MGEQPRVTMAGDGQVVHLVCRGSGSGRQVTVCGEGEDAYREPVPGARLCVNCEVTLGQMRQAAEQVRGGA